MIVLLACSHPGSDSPAESGTREDSPPGEAFDPSFTGWQDCRLVKDVATTDGEPDKIVQAPSVLAAESGFTMWASTESADHTTAIGRAESADGLAWSELEPALAPGTAGGTDTRRISTPSVLHDPDQGWLMYYDGVGMDDKVRIHRCSSEDGRSWEDCHLVKELGDVPGVDNTGVEIPFVLHDDDLWRMYYCGVTDGIYQILYSTSVDGDSWAPGRLLVPPGSEGSWDQIATYSPFVFKDGDRYRMLYTGRTPWLAEDGTEWQVKRLISAVSTDGEVWTDFQLSMDLGCEGTYDTWRVDEAHVLPVEGGWRLWYDGFDNVDFELGTRRILSAFRPD